MSFRPGFLPLKSPFSGVKILEDCTSFFWVFATARSSFNHQINNGKCEKRHCFRHVQEVSIPDEHPRLFLGAELPLKPHSVQKTVDLHSHPLSLRVRADQDGIWLRVRIPEQPAHQYIRGKDWIFFYRNRSIWIKQNWKKAIFVLPFSSLIPHTTLKHMHSEKGNVKMTSIQEQKVRIPAQTPWSSSSPLSPAPNQKDLLHSAMSSFFFFL